MSSRDFEFGAATPSYKVALTGASLVGKTTLSSYLSEHSPGRYVRTIDESGDDFFMSGRMKRYNRSSEERLQQILMSLEGSVHRSPERDQPDYVFTDGSVFDPAVRLAINGDKRLADEMADRADIWIPGKTDIAYNQVYVLDPADVKYGLGRSTHDREQERHFQHQMFQAFFRHHNIAFSVLSGSLQERADRVISELPKHDSDIDSELP